MGERAHTHAHARTLHADAFGTPEKRVRVFLVIYFILFVCFCFLSLR